MSREQEDELLAELSALRLKRRALIMKIVAARRKGKRDDSAIRQLNELSEEQIRLTNTDDDASVLAEACQPAL